MPLQKNQILTLRIERLSSDGSGVAHSADGETVFVPGTAPGDEARVRIVKDCGRYAFGILDELLTPSPDRVPVDCPVAGPCGGCSLRHLDYAAELRAKQESVLDAFRRIGGLEVPVLDILPSPEVDRYRNKVQFPVGVDKNGAPCIGFYAGRTHRIVPCPDCKLQPGVLNEIGNALCAFFAQQGIRPYDEQSGKGLVRHIFLRRGAHSGQIMVCLVCTRAKLPHAEQLCTALREQFPAISTILLNVNAKNTNVILGSENHILYGPGYIEDTLCGVPVRLGPLSFYQVNTLAAERLYGVAAQYAQLTPDDTLLDLYCGMGTIGLSMADQCRGLIGVEIVPEAIESAKANAARMGEAVAAKSRFFCADAGQAAHQRQAAAVDRDERMASGRKLVVRFGAVSSARFDLEADIGRTRSIGERFLCDVFDRDACRALLQLRRRTETRREGMFLAVELLAQAFEATACSDLRTAETEVDVKAFFDGLIDFVFDYIESRDKGFFTVYVSFLNNTFGDRFNADRTAEDDTGFIAFVARQITFADADIRLGRLDA